jgi:putative aldouronate transport system substrate-binding protein
MQDGEKAMLAAGVEDPTIGLYSRTDVSQGPVVNQGFIDGVADIVVGRRPLSDFDQLVKDWASKGGDTIRAEYQDALQHSK